MPRIGGHLDIVQVGDPTVPAAGRQHLYFKPDGKLYTRRPDSVVSEIGVGTTTIHTGTTVPNDAIGISGDYWHDTAGKKLYGPKGSNTAWGSAQTPTFFAGRQGAANTTIAVPTGTIVGDLLILVGNASGSFASGPTTLAGWTSHPDANTNDDSTHDSWTKTATSDDIANGVDVGTAVSGYYDLITYRNATSVRASAATAGTTAPVVALTADTKPTRAVLIANAKNGVVTVPGSVTLRYSSNGAGSQPIVVGDFSVSANATSADRPVVTATGSAALTTLVLTPSVAITQTDLADVDLSSYATSDRVTTLETKAKRSWPFSKSGALAVTTGTQRIYNDTGSTITLGTVRASVGTAPTGSSLTVVLAKGGVTLATASVAVAANTGTATGSFSWENGTYLTVNITDVGSTVAGSDLTLTLTEA